MFASIAFRKVICSMPIVLQEQVLYYCKLGGSEMDLWLLFLFAILTIRKILLSRYENVPKLPKAVQV